MVNPGDLFTLSRRLGRAGLIALGVWVAALAESPAAEHEVAVRNGFFAPNDLLIQPGDTVRWTYTGAGDGGCDPYGGCGDGEDEGVAHTVTADDGLFSSGAPADAFVYTFQFQQAGEYLYHCEQHSQPGQDINSNMNGRIVVQSSHAGFVINAGLNDAWFNPATPGQGFFINVFEDIGKMFVAWFTFDINRPDTSITALIGDPGHRWVTAFGDYADNQAVLQVEITQGGVFDAAEPAPGQTVDGTLTLEFSDCNAATVSYSFPSLSLQGAVPIQRIALDNLPACQAKN